MSFLQAVLAFVAILYFYYFFVNSILLALTMVKKGSLKKYLSDVKENFSKYNLFGRILFYISALLKFPSFIVAIFCSTFVEGMEFLIENKDTLIYK